MAGEKKIWLENAKNFVAETFPEWETKTRVLPPFSDGIRPSLVTFLSAMGENSREPMFIVCIRDVKQMTETRCTGGLYERLEDIQGSDHAVVVIDKLRGLFLIDVCHIDETQESGDSRLQRMQEKCDDAKSHFKQLMASLKEVGMENNQRKKCLPFHFPMIAFPRVGKKGKTPQNALVLYKEECETQAVFESWWNERVVENPEVKKSGLHQDTYKTLLAIFAAPLYVTPSSETSGVSLNFLTDEELDILVNEPTKCLIKGDSADKNMKLMKEKVRSVATRWFARRPIIESERMLVVGPSKDVVDQLSEAMPEWIVRSAVAAYSTRTSKSEELKYERVRGLINANLTFCTLNPEDITNETMTLIADTIAARKSMVAGNSKQSEEKAGDGSEVKELPDNLKETQHTDADGMSEETETKLLELSMLLRYTESIFLPDQEKGREERLPAESNDNDLEAEALVSEMSKEKDVRSSCKKPSVHEDGNGGATALKISLKNERSAEASMPSAEMEVIQPLRCLTNGIGLASLLEMLSLTSQEKSISENEDTKEEVRKLHIPQLQAFQESKKKFDHVFVIGIQELYQNFYTLWFHDLCALHLGHAKGHFWLFSTEDALPGNLNEEFNSYPVKVVSRTRRNEPAEEWTWLYQAQEFIKRTYPDWGTEHPTRLVPPVRDFKEWIDSSKDDGEKAERTLMHRLYEMGRKLKIPMFITFNRDFSHTMKKKDVGGGLERTLEIGEQDLVLIHRDFGVIFIEVKNLQTKSTGKALANTVRRNIKLAKEQLEKDVNSLEAAMRECGVEDIHVSLPIVALTNVKRTDIGISSAETNIFICEEDCQSVATMERWWQEDILQSRHLQSLSTTAEVYLQLLAIYIAPVYVTPAYTARAKTQTLNFLTEDKLDILINGPKKFVFKGAAGTGKTWLLQEKIRNIVMSWFSLGPIEDRDEKILLVCAHLLLTEHLEKTLPDLLFTSVMATLSKWIDETEVEREKVRKILQKNIIICSLGIPESRLGVRHWEEDDAQDDQVSRVHEVIENDKLSVATLTSRMKYASWEILLYYNLLKISVATLQSEERGRWPQVVQIIHGYFQSFTPSILALRALAKGTRMMYIQETKNLHAHIGENPAIKYSLRGIMGRLGEFSARVVELPAITQQAFLKDLENILKNREPPFHHIFVDEAEDLCTFYDQYGSIVLRSLFKGGNGYFWQAYDPFHMAMPPNAVKSDLESAHPLYEVMRNPESVFEKWTGENLSQRRDISTLFNYEDPTYKKKEVRLGHKVRGPNVELFPDIPASRLTETIQEVLGDNYGVGCKVGDIAILITDESDILVHADRLRKEMEEYLKDSSSSVLVASAGAVKGLEAPIVFLITNKRAKRISDYYLGASRCTSRLLEIELVASEEEDEAAVRAIFESPQNTLPDAAPQEAKDEVERILRIAFMGEKLMEGET